MPLMSDLSLILQFQRAYDRYARVYFNISITYNNTAVCGWKRPLTVVFLCPFIAAKGHGEGLLFMNALTYFNSGGSKNVLSDDFVHDTDTDNLTFLKPYFVSYLPHDHEY